MSITRLTGDIFRALCHCRAYSIIALLINYCRSPRQYLHSVIKFIHIVHFISAMPATCRPSIHRSNPRITQQQSLIKEAPYSFLKSRKHTFQIQKLLHSYFVRRIKLNVWCITAFLRIRNCNEKMRNCSCYGNNDVSKWMLICV